MPLLDRGASRGRPVALVGSPGRRGAAGRAGPDGPRPPADAGAGGLVRAGPWIFLFVAGLLAAGVGLATPGPGPTPTAPNATIGCVECHIALDDATITPPAKAFADDVHAHAGFTCADCHGGDPKAEDQDGRARSEEGLPRKAGAPRHSAPVRDMSRRRRGDEALQSIAAGRPALRVPHQRPRQGARSGRCRRSRPAPAATARTESCRSRTRAHPSTRPTSRRPATGVTATPG